MTLPPSALRLSALVLAALLSCLACQGKESKVSEHLARAKAYQEEGKHSEAIIEFKNVLQADPNHADAHFGLSQSFLSTNKLRQAYWELRESVRLDPSNFDARLQFGQLSNMGGELDEALTQADAILAADSEEADAYRLRAMLLRAQVLESKSQPGKALDAYEAAVELAPDVSTPTLLLANFHRRTGNDTLAEPLFRKLTEMDPGFVSYAALGGFLARDRDRDAEAEAAYLKALEIAPEERRELAYRTLGGFYYSRDRFDEAEAIMKQALEEQPDNLELLYTLARFYRVQGDEAKADAMIRAATEAHPDEVRPYLILSLYRSRVGDLDGALEAAEKALAVDPNSNAARLRKAELLVDIGSRRKQKELLAEGLSMVDVVLAKDASNPEAMFVKAKVDLAEGRTADSIAALRRALDLRPDWAQAHFLLGSALFLDGDRNGARSELARALEIDASFTEARMVLARVQASLGEQELAVEEGRRALKEREDASMRILVAQSLARQGKLDEALEELAHVPEDQRDAETLYAFGRLFAFKGDLAKAREFFERANELRPYHEDILRSLLDLDRLQGRLAESQQRVDEAVDAKPEDSGLLRLQGTIALMTGDVRKAERLFRKSIDINPNDLRSYGSLATLLAATGRVDETIETYERALEKRPEQATLYLIVGSLYELRGDHESAMANYEQAIRRNPNLGPAKNNLAYLLAEDGKNLDRALDLAQEAKALLPDNPNAADTLGWVLYKKGIPSAAIGYLQEAEGGLPPNELNLGIVRHHLALAYEANGDAERARKTLERALADLESLRSRQATPDGRLPPEPGWAAELRAMLERLETAPHASAGEG